MQREHSRPGEKIGKGLEGGAAAYLKDTGMPEMEIFKSSPGNKRESLLTFKTRVYHINGNLRRQTNLAAMFREGRVGELKRERSIGATPAIQGQRWD